MAHPGNNLKGRLELLEDIVNMGIKGIEAYSSYHSPEQNSYFVQKAKEYELLITVAVIFMARQNPWYSWASLGWNKTEWIFLKL